ncbi:putative phage abortive infection protein [Aeromonas salmonicida]|uniref:putative phage abortive infection protein n=1 Tax=Aeromonas salmonicida TaxID=645 RepID=UPI00240DB01D|nr:putative phage abortive infection protein [Aeromonas salmonicida]WFC14740.1 putative phage abortive infection protein [Aeromonas salmonicida]
MKKYQKNISSIIVSSCIALVALTTYVFYSNFKARDTPVSIEKWGQLGDYFGGTLNPLFGFASVLLVAITLRMQIVSSQKQEFENQFFSILSFYQNIIQSIDLMDQKGKITKGRDCLRVFFIQIEKRKRSKKTDTPIMHEYNQFLDERSWELEHYFRTIYQLFRHVKDGVDEELINTRESKKYYDLIKSQLSSYELGLLMLNCNGRNKGRWDDIVNDPIACPFEHISDKIMAICENK